MHHRKAKQQESRGTPGGGASPSRITFDMLGRLPLVLDYLDAFRKVTGIGLKLVAPSENKPTPVPSRRAAHGRIISRPVVCDGTHVATLLTDAVAIAPATTPGRKRMGATAATRWAADSDVASDGSGAAISSEQRDGMDRLLSLFAQHISAFASRYMLAPAGTEPDCVMKARNYIHSHATEPLTSQSVAGRVGVSRQHFCKVFRRSTGMTFTEYLSRCRVERAKDLLVNRSRRVADIAFEAGFQSIPQFNRAFRKYAGTEPTAWRKAANAERNLAQQKRTGEETTGASRWQSPR